MLGAAVIVAGIAIVDSLNPGTIAPALVLAVSDRPVRRILEFAAGFFVVNVAGGLLLTLGLSALPSPSDHVKHSAALVAGVALLAGAVVLFAARGRLTRPKPDPPETRRRGGSALVFGAALAAAELPTAFPYFAAIAAIEAAHLSFAGQLLLVVGFNLLFLLPVFAIAVLIRLFPSTWESFITPIRQWMRAHWPVVLGIAMALGGTALVVYGLSS